MGKRVKKLQEPNLENDTVRRANRQSTYLDDQGRELPNPTPIAPPLGYQKQPTIRETIRNMVLSERLRQEAQAAGVETFEEADDFEVGDDYDPTSPYEEVFEPLPVVDHNKTLATAIADELVSKLGTADPSATPKPEGAPEAPPLPPAASPPSGVPTPSNRLFSR